MKKEYYVHADFWECRYTKRREGSLIKTTKSYNQAVKIACELTESPAVLEATVWVNDPTSLVHRKLFSCSRDDLSFDPNDIDADLVYTTKEGKVVRPPAQYYELRK
jgi:hypothetical protein